MQSKSPIITATNSIKSETHLVVLEDAIEACGYLFLTLLRDRDDDETIFVKKLMKHLFERINKKKERNFQQLNARQRGNAVIHGRTIRAVKLIKALQKIYIKTGKGELTVQEMQKKIDLKLVQSLLPPKAKDGSLWDHRQDFYLKKKYISELGGPLEAATKLVNKYCKDVGSVTYIFKAMKNGAPLKPKLIEKFDEQELTILIKFINNLYLYVHNKKSQLEKDFLPSHGHNNKPGRIYKSFLISDLDDDDD